MKVARTIKEFRRVRNEEMKGKTTLGFVPTMGALHQGHLSLLNLSSSQNDVTAASIFVNPTQFSAKEDFEQYPRVEEQDLRLLEEQGVNLVFCPTANELYPPNFSTSITIHNIQNTLEAKSRPHHFPGVATVVAKLFNIVQPTKAYFGKKDATQTVVIQQLVRELNIPTEIILGETLREDNGLAMSSRNKYLSKEFRERAGIIFRSITKGEEFIKDEGWENVKCNDIVNVVWENLKEEKELEVIYVAVESCVNGLPLERLTEEENGAILSVACTFGGVRLIDNIRLHFLEDPRLIDNTICQSFYYRLS